MKQPVSHHGLVASPCGPTLPLPVSEVGIVAVERSPGNTVSERPVIFPFGPFVEETSDERHFLPVALRLSGPHHTSYNGSA
jgi:hypothetical protein